MKRAIFSEGEERDMEIAAMKAEETTKVVTTNWAAGQVGGLRTRLFMLICGCQIMSA